VLINSLNINPPKSEIFTLGPISVHWYGLFLVLAIFLGLKLSFFWAKKYKIYQEKFWSLAFYLIILGFLGARLYHVFSEFNYYQNRILAVFFIWQGGLGFYGALILGSIFLYFWARKNKISFLAILDLIAPSLALGEIFVRLGNYFNQEIFSRSKHFFYQIVINFFIFVILFLFSKRSVERIKNNQKFFFGQIFFIYLLLNSLFRFFFEFLRIDPQPIIFNLRLGQIVSIFLFLIGCLGLVYLKAKAKKLSYIFPKPQ